MSVVVVGSLNADLTVRTDRFPQPGETVTGSELVVAPGGKGSNQAAAAAVLGAAVRMVGATGDDPHGALLREAARRVGVDVGGVRRLAAHATGTAMIVVDGDGENVIIVSPGANGAVVPEMVTTADVAGAGVVTLCLEIPLPAVEAAVAHAHDAGAVVVFNLSPYREVPAALLAQVDVLLVNESEAAQLVGADPGGDWAGVGDTLRGRGVRRAVVTLGGDGCVVLDDTAAEPVQHIPGVRVDVVDTTGCGDAFTGAVAQRLDAGATLTDAARFAVEVGALAATAAGAQSSYQRFAHLRAH